LRKEKSFGKGKIMIYDNKSFNKEYALRNWEVSRITQKTDNSNKFFSQKRTESWKTLYMGIVINDMYYSNYCQ